MRKLFKIIGSQVTIKYQDPVTLSEFSQPEPDLVIVKNKPDDYVSNHPRPEDIIIEIAEISLIYEQQVKLSLYAEADLEFYWIFNLIHRQLETYQQPYQKYQGNFGYRQQQIFLSHQKVLIPNFPNLELNLEKIFPG